MKKIIIITIILSIVFFAVRASAQSKPINWLGDLNFTRITNYLIDQEQIINYKFEDSIKTNTGTSTVTCYGSYVKNRTQVISVALSCVK
jgi:hypothetical protein